MRTVLEVGSTVGGIHSAIIQFKPTSIFPTNGEITIIGLPISGLGNSAACSNYIEICKPFAAVGSCTILDCNFYLPNKIVITPNNPNDITGEIELKIRDVKYATSMETSSITVESTYHSYSECEIGTVFTFTNMLEAGTCNDWRADLPSPFATPLSLTFDPLTLTTCGTNTLTWKATIKSIGITANSKIKIQFFAKDNINIDIKMNCGSITSSNINSLQSPGANQITGLISNTRLGNTELSFSISGIKLPTTNIEFYSVVTTYTQTGSDIVYSQSTDYFRAIQETRDLTDSITESSNMLFLTVAELNSYELTIPTGCGTVDLPQFFVTYPQVFNSGSQPCPATSGCVLATGDNQGSLTTGIVKLVFELSNPICEKTTAITGDFKIDVYDGKIGGIAYSFKAKLDSDIKYNQGQFNSFDITPKEPESGVDSCRGVGDKCIYEFGFSVRHGIPAGGNIKVKFTEDFGCIDTGVVNVDASIGGIDFITTGQCDPSTHIVTINTNRDLPSGSNVIIKFKYIKNPFIIKTYSDISVTSYTSLNCPIDTKTGINVVINAAGTATVTCVPTSFKNLAQTDYTIEFTSPNFDLPPTSATYYLIMTVISDVTNCITPTVNPLELELKSSLGSTRYEFEIKTGARSKVSFRINCMNPAITTAKNPFRFFLCADRSDCDGSGTHILQGNCKVQTKEGADLDITILSSTMKEPKASSLVTITIKRNALAEDVERIDIRNSFFESSSMCTARVNPNGICSWANDVLSFTFSPPINSKQFEVKEIRVANPERPNHELSGFSITTYNGINVDPVPIVDQSENIGVLPVDCNYPCATCASSDFEQCHSCITTIDTGKYFYYYPSINRCKAAEDSVGCETGYIKSSSARVCNACESQCLTCKDTTTYCLECSTNYALSGICVSADVCTNGNYRIVSGRKCVPCDPNCLKCQLISTECIDCPEKSFLQSGTCKPCSNICHNCENYDTHCTSCDSGKYLELNTCVTSCSIGRGLIGGICELCDSLCSECAGTITHCVSCVGNYYAYKGNCHAECPAGTMIDTGLNKVCVSCANGCDTCALDSSSKIYCIECNTQYKYLDGKCYLTCPENYETSSDSLSCVKVTEVPHITKSFDYLPFPHFMSTALLALVTTAGQSRDGRALLISNLVIVVNYITLSSYVFQMLFSFAESETMICLITAITMVVQVLLNILFLIPYNRTIANDEGFRIWAQCHSCIKVILISLSTIFSFQTLRLFYSRFLGFGVFFAQFKDFDCILNNLNYFSIVQALVVYCPVIAIDILSLIKLPWGTNLYVIMIESLVLSLMLLLMLCYEMKNLSLTKEELEHNNKNYKAINDKTSTEFTKENGREESIKDDIKSVFSHIGLMPNSGVASRKLNKKKKRIERRQSFSETSSSLKEEDSKNTSSYPCSPRTIKNKTVPLDQPSIDNKRNILPSELKDNVYSDAVPPKDLKLITPKEMSNAEVQTIPLEKIAAFKKHLQAQKSSKKKDRRLFDDEDNSRTLAVIDESPEEDLSKELRKAETTANLMNSTIIHMMNDRERKLRSLDPKKPNSPPQSSNSNEVIDDLKSKPLQPIDKTANMKSTRTLRDTNKTPDIFVSEGEFSFNLVNHKEVIHEDKNLESPKGNTETNKVSDQLIENVKEQSKSSKQSTKANVIENTKGKMMENVQGVGVESTKEQNPPICTSEELRGSFEKDLDGYLLIKENVDGVLEDLRGRVVNNQGYLIDRGGNIINRNGNFIMSKAEFDRLIDNKKNEPKDSTVQENKLLKEEPINTQDVYDVTKVENIADSIHREDSKLSKSASFESIMDDTPSNYNILNQSHYHPLESAQKNLLKQPSQPARDTSSNELARQATKVYGKSLKKHHNVKITNKSLRKKSITKAFTIKDQSGYASDDNKQSSYGDSDPKQEPEETKEPDQDVVRFQTIDGNSIKESRNQINDSLTINPKEGFEFDIGDNQRDEIALEREYDVSIDPMARSNYSRTSNSRSAAKIKGLESIYLKRIRNKRNSKNIAKRQLHKKEITSDHDDIASLLSDNYEAMRQQFKRRVKVKKIPKDN